LPSSLGLASSWQKACERAGERTQELQEIVEELEKFHKLTAGRELKMIELKKRDY